MPKTNFQYVAPPNENQSTTITDIFLDRLNAAVPTGEDIDGSLPLLYAADTGAADAYAITMSFGYEGVSFPQAYVAGQVFRFKAANTNTGASTLNVNSLGAKAIKKFISQDIEAGDIQAGEIITVVYDGTNFQLSGLSYRKNYAADTGAADAYVADPIPAYTQLFEGLKVTFKAANANTGASTLNVNGLGAVAIKELNGNALGAGAIKANQIITVLYDGTNFVLLSPLNNSQIKAWINFNGTGAIAIRDSYNVSSIVDNGVGDYTVTWDKDFANINYASPSSAGGGIALVCVNGTKAVGTLQIQVFNDAGVAVDTTGINILAIGDQ